MKVRRNDHIEQQATDLLAEFGFDDIPVDVFGLVASLGVSVAFEIMEDDISAILLIESDVPKMAINADHHSNRQRFSAAHEVGHFLLHHTGGDQLFVDQATYYRNQFARTGLDKQEIEANRFGAELLMPRHRLLEQIEPEEPLKELEIFALADRFQVSEHAMTLRLVRLGLLQP